ncbi:MAG: DUF1836 domain-containing protein [Slackia sp.]
MNTAHETQRSTGTCPAETRHAHPCGSDEEQLFVAHISGLHIPRYAELPDIELYMDQVLTYTDNQLRPLFPKEEKILTSSMVNNYVKQKLIPTPLHKRYGREHLALLIFVCLMKRTVPISDIQRLFAIQNATYPVERAYDFFCTAVEESLRALSSSESVRADALGEWELEKPAGSLSLFRLQTAANSTPARRLVISAATATANKIYIEKCLEFMELDLSKDEQQ